MRRLPDWYKATFALVLGLWLILNVMYRLGADGVQFGGATTSFERQYDGVLHRIDDRHALRRGSAGDFAVVMVERGPIPFCPLCGVYQPAGSVVNVARFFKDGWIYTDHPTRFFEAVNVDTGATIDVPERHDPGDTSLPPELAARGLEFADAHLLTDALVAARFPALATINESCIVFNAAFLLLVGLHVLLAPLLWLRRRP